MDRRAFLKTLTQAAALAAATGSARRARAASPWKMTVVATGDYIPGQRLSRLAEPDLAPVVELLRGADCTWTNCEAVLAEVGDVYPVKKGRDPHVLAAPWGADELAWMGVDLAGTANNHTMDWGDRGLFSTLRNLERVGIAHAGAGADLARAASPAYTDTSAGRVAMVNCAVSFLEFFQAGPSHPYVPGRPGLNPAQLEYKTQVPRPVFEKIRSYQIPTLERVGWKRYAHELLDTLSMEDAEEAFFGDTMTVVPGEGFDILATLRAADRERILESVKVARNNSRVVIASTHAHEANGDLTRSEPAVEDLARATIDAGADLFVSAGPHVLRGIEIHAGKPIFYSLANFVFQHGANHHVPAEGYAVSGLPADTLDRSQTPLLYTRYPEFWRSVLPRVTVESQGSPDNETEQTEVTRIELFPITLGFGEPIYRRGVPLLARGRQAEEILEHLAELSAPYGTRIEIRDGVGEVML